MALHTIRTLLRRFMYRAGPTLPLRAICTGLQTDTFGGGGWVFARIPLFTFVVLSVVAASDPAPTRVRHLRMLHIGLGSLWGADCVWVVPVRPVR